MSVVEVETAEIMVDATTSDGRRFVAFSVHDEANTVRIFYGQDSDLRERKLLANNTNSAIILDFDVDGARMSAVLLTPFSGPYFGTASHLQSSADPQSFVPLTRVEGSPGYGQDSMQAIDGGAGNPQPPRKPDAELLAGLTLECF
jgi:hypothetical protein